MTPHKNVRKKTRILTLFILTIGLSLSAFNLFTLNLFSSNTKMDDKSNLVVFEDRNLKTSSYPQTFENSGEDINVSLHQSYVNTSFDTIVNTSVVNGNSFTLPSPTDVNFNSSFVNITVKDIYAPNKTLSVEEDYQSIIGYNLAANQPYASFTVVGSSYLENISAVLYNDDSRDGQLQVRIYNSTWNSGLSRNEPSSSYTTLVQYADGYIVRNYDGWYNFTNLDHYLDSSKTDNNTFYIYIRDGNDNAQWRYAMDSSVPDNSDDQLAYEYNPGLLLINPSGDTIDLTLLLDLYLQDNTPKPSNIKLKINGTNLNDNGIDNRGYWSNTDEYGSADGELNFEVTADWWDVECNISQVQINYTKTDLKASSNFEVSGSGQDIVWNVTRNSGLAYFDTNFGDYRINFTIPSIWNEINIQVFNGTDNRTSTINKRLLGSGYRDVEVPNAGNGTYWFLNTTSSNLLSAISTYVGGVAYDTVNYTNIVRFNVTFSEIVMNGTLNLSIYSPTPN
ncbi:hypothetical protein LCGC14_2446700, partial [marine sediment metagenome]